MTDLPKLSRKALEKIWNILQEIENQRGITTTEDDLVIPQVHMSRVRNEREALDASNERLTILRKLENEEKAIKDIRWSNDVHGLANLKLGEKYFEVLNYYELEYKKIALDYQQRNKQDEIKTTVTDIVYEAKYSEKSHELLVNNFLLAKPDFNSENEAVFSYLYQNPNKTIKTQDLEQRLGGRLKKPIHSILRDLGFTGTMAKVFFSASKNGVLFRNPITYQDLKDLGVERIKIQVKK